MPGEDLGIRPRYPRRGFQQAVALGVLADGEQDLAHGPLDAGQVDRSGSDVAGPLALRHRADYSRAPCTPLGRGGASPGVTPAGWVSCAAAASS